MFKLILQKIERKKENFVIEEEEKQPGKSEAVGDKEGRIEGDMVVMCWLFDGPGLLHLFKKRMISFPKISRTSCTSGGELCNLIIDSGSSKNIVSQEMIDKLKLTMVKHPQPYHIIWFNKGNEVLTSSKYLVNFSIGDSLKDNGCMPHSSRSSMTI